jgi:hypothetical protein
VGVALGVRAQVDNFGWQIDLAVRSGLLDCTEVVNAYEYVAARSTLNVSGNLAGPYQLYTNGVSVFLSNAEGLYLNCKNFLNGQDDGSGVPHSQWANARTKVNESHELLSQAIAAAGGTP